MTQPITQVSYPEQDMDLYLEVQREHALTGAPVALVVRRALRAQYVREGRVTSAIRP